jgi:hypothetical protein
VPLIESMRTYGREWLGADCGAEYDDESDDARQPAAAAA